MTTYKIDVGYNSNLRWEEVLTELKSVVLDIQQSPERIVEEVLRIEPNLTRDIIEEYAEPFRSPVTDLTLEMDDDGVIMLASGGGRSRALKESCRRAFCRLVLDAMHRKCMEISILVS